MKYLFCVTIIKDEVEACKQGLTKSLNIALDVLKEELFILILAQDCHPELSGRLTDKNHRIISLPRTPVSKARNIGLNHARSHGFTYIYFHDSSIILTESFCYQMKEMNSLHSLLLAEPAWTNEYFDNLSPSLLIPSQLELIKGGYVWAYLFPVTILDDINFIETIGPGSDKDLLAGEDVAFMQAIKRKFPDISVYRSPTKVFHPHRSEKDDKRIKYARGQGALYRYLLQPENLSAEIILYIAFFWMNALIGVILNKPSASEILKRRWLGFTSNDYKFFYHGK